MCRCLSGDNLPGFRSGFLCHRPTGELSDDGDVCEDRGRKIISLFSVQEGEDGYCEQEIHGAAGEDEADARVYSGRRYSFCKKIYKKQTACGVRDQACLILR